MKNTDSKIPRFNAVRAINSIYDLAYGTPEESEKLSNEEIRSDLKNLGVDTEKGWQAMQSLLKSANGKLRLAVAREQRLKAKSELSPQGSFAESAQTLIEQIRGLLLLSEGNASVFARKAESMPVEDLISLRDQLVKTAARAAKKRHDAG
jgi:hypothetical protein